MVSCKLMVAPMHMRRRTWRIVPKMDTPCVSNIEPDPVILDMDFRMFVWHESHMGVQRPYKPVTQSAKVVLYA